MLKENLNSEGKTILHSLQYPKVLVISQNAFSKNMNNGKTYSSIFTGWPIDRIAQLFLKEESPDFSVCNNFFKVTEKDLLFKKKERRGQIVKNEVVMINTEKSSVLAMAKSLPFFIFARDILWSIKDWNNNKLADWIKNFSPDVIFFVGGGSSFSYSIVNKIIERYKLPLFLYYTDDYITSYLKLDVFRWVNWWSLKYSLSKSLPHVKKIFVIGEDMAIEYTKKLGKTCIPLMNAVDIKSFSEVREVQSFPDSLDRRELSLAYFGGLHLNRWKTLSEIGKAIESLTLDGNLNVSLSIYSNDLPKKSILNSLNKKPFIKFIGKVNSDQIIKEMQKYDILVHVESFQNKMIKRTRLSISTKIPEYLASGKPILAVGPKEISSIRYMKRLKISYIISMLEKERIKETLLIINKDKEFHSKIGEIGIKIAENNHSITLNRIIIQKYLSETLLIK